MRNIYYIALVLILIGCRISNEEKLASNPTIAAVFDQSEIKDLAVILDFFNGHICAEHKNDISKCYQRFFERMLENEKAGNMTLDFPEPEKQKMYGQISETKFSQIWRIYRERFPTFRNTSDSIEIKSIIFTAKYVNFLKEFGDDHHIVKQYYDSYISVGDISPVSCSIVLNEYKQFDAKDIRIQLFIAMHYLTEDYNGGEVEKRIRNVSYSDYLKTMFSK